MNKTLTCMAAFCLAATSVMGDAVTRSYADLDKDGVDEVILENKYIRVAVMTGVASENPPKLLRKDGRPQPYKYGNRFNWGGWIYSYEFKPTKRDWFVHIFDNGENWHGIPEEFEEAIPMAELSPNRFAAMMPGIGTGIGTGRCFRGSLKDVVHAPWTLQEDCEVDGVWQSATKAIECASAWRLSFRQVISSDYGYGCECTKTLTMRAGSALLEVDRTLKNTGDKPFQTTWFTHGFWGQGEDGGFDGDSWSTIPLRPPRVDGTPFPADLTDTEQGRPLNFKPAYYWGPIAKDELGGSWHVTGNSRTGDIFASVIGKPVSFFRVWTDEKTYSCEPFLEINLKPGETYAWRDNRAACNGLRSIKWPGEAAMLDWEVQRDAAQLCFKVLPYVEGNGRIRVYGTLTANGRKQSVDLLSDSMRYSPEAVVELPVSIPVDFVTAPSVAFSLQVDLLDAKGTVVANAVTVNRSYDLSFQPFANVDAKQAVAVIFSDISKQDNGWKLNAQSRFWEQYLLGAGFKVEFAHWQAAEENVPWNTMSLAVIAAGRVSPNNLKRLEAFAQNGGGVIFQGPVDFRSYELSGILPIEKVLGEINMNMNGPRDGTRDFTVVTDERYHLKPQGESSITAGLPWYPRSYQSVGTFQIVKPKAEANVVLSLVPGKAMPQGTTYPALVTSTYGKGRIVLLASPLQWGVPAADVIWGRLGEYHRQFAMQLAAWTAKGNLYR